MTYKNYRYSLCKGGCGSLLRGHGQFAEDHPGTKVLASRGMCQTCYRVVRAEMAEARAVEPPAPEPRELTGQEKRVVEIIESRSKGGDRAELIAMLGLTGFEVQMQLLSFEFLASDVFSSPDHEEYADAV